MYCDFCDGSGQRVAYYNDKSIYYDCPHCRGSGYEANNHYGSYDEEWIKFKQRDEEYY